MPPATRKRAAAKKAAPKAPVYSAELVARALELRRAGATPALIGAELGIDSAEVLSVLDVALAAIDVRWQPALEKERLERMFAGIWTRAARGDLPSIDRAVKIGERLERVLADPKPNAHELRRAFDESVESSKALDVKVDAALIASGRAIADRVDEALANGEGTEITKALYLLPHLMNILREMQATPTARLTAAAAAGSEGGSGGSNGNGSKLSQLRGLAGGKAG